MNISRSLAALLSSAAFAFSDPALSQVEVVDLTAPQQPAAPAPSAPTSAVQSQGELFYQLQLMQQEVMELRGIVEEQTHELEKLKRQSMERYIDLDSRIGQLVNQPAASAGKASSATPTAAKPARGVALEGEKDAYAAANKLVTNRQFDKALASFNQLLVDYPGGKYAPNSYYWLGELYQVVTPQDLEAARQSFTQLLDQYPDHPKVPDAMYKLGKVYFLKGDKTRSRELLEKVVADYGNGVNPAADKAHQFLSTNF